MLFEKFGHEIQINVRFRYNFALSFVWVWKRTTQIVWVKNSTFPVSTHHTLGFFSGCVIKTCTNNHCHSQLISIFFLKKKKQNNQIHTCSNTKKRDCKHKIFYLLYLLIFSLFIFYSFFGGPLSSSILCLVWIIIERQYYF